METAIRVSNVSKRFRVATQKPDSIKTILIQIFKGKMALWRTSEFEALSNINFEIKKGEFIGILGANGAGKSTLLKLITGIYEPTTGEIKVLGQIAPLIELGAGFDIELSGYENIFLNAAILGIGREATLAAVEDIIEFSGIREHIFKAVRTFSSGMLVRLGFSIACHLEAPILLMDEVLAVGDIEFQEKCLKRIQRMHQDGRTIVLITHDINAVKNFCSRSLVIANKKLIFDGPPSDAVDRYLRALRGN